METFDCAYCAETTQVESESVREDFLHDCEHCGKTNQVEMVTYLVAHEYET